MSFYRKEKPKQNDLATIKEQTELWLDPDKISTAYEIYQEVFGNKIYRSKMQTVILCVCICMAYWKHMGVGKVQHFLNYFGISEKDYKKGTNLFRKKLGFNRHVSIKSHVDTNLQQIRKLQLELFSFKNIWYIIKDGI